MNTQKICNKLKSQISPVVKLGVIRMILSLAILPTPSFAGGVWGSGGGGAVVCFDAQATRDQVIQVLIDNAKNGTSNEPLPEEVVKKIESVTLLDLYLSGIDPDILQARASGDYIRRFHAGSYYSPNATDGEYSRKMYKYNSLNDLKYTISDHLNVMTGAFQILKKFDLEWKYLNNSIRQVPDSNNPAIIGEKCAELQVASQSFLSDTEVQVYVDNRLYQKMNQLNQAALYFHEWFYAWARSRGQTDSSRVRRVIEIIFSPEFTYYSVLLKQAVSGVQFNQLLTSMGFMDRDNKIWGTQNIIFFPDLERIYISVPDYSDSAKMTCNFKGEDCKKELFDTRLPLMKVLPHPSLNDPFAEFRVLQMAKEIFDKNLLNSHDENLYGPIFNGLLPFTTSIGIVSIDMTLPTQVYYYDINGELDRWGRLAKIKVKAQEWDDAISDIKAFQQKYIFDNCNKRPLDKETELDRYYCWDIKPGDQSTLYYISLFAHDNRLKEGVLGAKFCDKKAKCYPKGTRIKVDPKGNVTEISAP